MKLPTDIKNIIYDMILDMNYKEYMKVAVKEGYKEHKKSEKYLKTKSKMNKYFERYIKQKGKHDDIKKKNDVRRWKFCKKAKSLTKCIKNMKVEDRYGINSKYNKTWLDFN